MSRALIVINTAADREKAAGWCRGAPWGTRVEFKKAKRTLDQNAMFWALLTEVASQVEHAGTKYTTEEWKLLFMHAWGREVRFLPGLDRKSVVPVGQSSSDLSTEEMTSLIEFILAEGAKRGVVFASRSNTFELSASADGGSSGATPETSPAAVRNSGRG